MRTTSAATQRLRLPLLAVALTLLTLLGLSSPARAQLDFILTPDTLSGRPGDTLTFSGTLTNTGSDELFLNSDNFTLASADFTLDDSPFFTNFPLSLQGGESASGALFTVSIDPSAPVDLYTGAFSILGGLSDSDFNELATQSFSVAVPEPGIYALLLCSSATIGLASLRRRQARRVSASATGQR